MHLFNIDDFGMRFGINTAEPDFRRAVEEASRAATATIASRFRYRDFDYRSSVTDYFHDPFTKGVPEKATALLLSRGFIDPAVDVKISGAETPLHWKNGATDLLTNFRDLYGDGASDMALIDMEKGWVHLHGVSTTDKWVIVNYACGFGTNSVLEYESVPEWLTEAAALQAIIMLKQNNIFKTDTLEDTTSLEESLGMLFSSHARYAPLALKPTTTEV